MMAAYVVIASIYTFILITWTKMNYSRGKGITRQWHEFWKEYDRHEKECREIESIRVTTRYGNAFVFEDAREIERSIETYKILDGNRAIVGKFPVREVVGIFVNRKGEAK